VKIGQSAHKVAICEFLCLDKVALPDVNGMAVSITFAACAFFLVLSYLFLSAWHQMHEMSFRSDLKHFSPTANGVVAHFLLWPAGILPFEWHGCEYRVSYMRVSSGTLTFAHHKDSSYGK